MGIDDSAYKSPYSVAKRATIPIDINDPRLRWDKKGIHLARSGTDFQIVDIAGQTLATLSSDGSALATRAASDANTFTASYANVASALTGSGTGTGGVTGIDNPTAPLIVQNLAASWDGDDLVVTFDFDTTDSANQYFNYFNIYFLPIGSANVYVWNPQKNTVNRTSTSQSFRMTTTIAQSIFNGTPTDFATIGVSTEDLFMNESVIQSIAGPPYSNGLPAPTVTISSVNNGYSVAYTNPTQKNFYGVEVAEIESSSASEPTGTYTITYDGKLNPAIIITPNGNQRWVKARFLASNNTWGPYCAAVAVTPTNPVSVDLSAPNDSTNVSGVWSGNDIVITYTLPSTKPGYRTVVKLTAPDNSTSAYFYSFPNPANTTQTFTIKKADLFAQFGTYFSSFSGILYGSSIADVLSSGTSFNVAARANPFLVNGVLVKPTFSLTPAANGYIISWNLVSGATYADIYESSTSWASNPTDESKRVYSGQSPVTIQSLNYNTRYIKIRFYDDYGDTSDYSDQQTVTPYDPGLLSLINNPVAFQTNGSIYAGTYNPSNPADPSGSSAHAIFNKTGLYVYDSTGKPTTQIIGDQSTVYDPTKTDGTKLTSSVTFLTQNAQIADWSISQAKIENTLYGGISGAQTYTGLSASGTYAFWAGSSTAGGDANAKFSVKPDGSVIARNIAVYGGSLTIGSNFSVAANTGILNASGAIISGALTATSGFFSGDVNIKSTGALFSTADPAYTPGQPYTSANVKSGYVLNVNGLTFNNSSGSYVTKIDASSGSFTTNSAVIGGWNVDSSTINKAGVTLDSSTPTPSISATKGTYSTGITAPSSNNATTDVVMWAGPAIYSGSTDTRTSAGFRVLADGTMYADKANITGTVTAQGPNYKIQMNPTSNNEYLSFGTSSTINGLMYTRDTAIIMQPGSTVGYGAVNAGVMINGTPYIVLDKTTQTVKIGVNMDATNTYTAGNKVYNYAASQYIAFGPNGVSITAPPYMGNLSDTIAGDSNVNGNQFVRMVIQSPRVGDNSGLKTGPAIYYLSNKVPGSGSTGLVGDLWLEY